MLSEISQRKKDKHCMILLICETLKKSIHRSREKDWWWPELRVGETGKVLQMSRDCPIITAGLASQIFCPSWIPHLTRLHISLPYSTCPHSHHPQHTCMICCCRSKSAFLLFHKHCQHKTTAYSKLLTYQMLCACYACACLCSTQDGWNIKIRLP